MKGSKEESKHYHSSSRDHHSSGKDHHRYREEKHGKSSRKTKKSEHSTDHHRRGEKGTRSRSISPKRKTDDQKKSTTEVKVEEKDPLGYETMTPAERLRAKVKVLINKSESTKQENTAVPNPVHVMELENDDFTPQQFTSKRKDRFNKDESEQSTLASHDNAIFGKSTPPTIENQLSLRLPLTMKAIEVPIVDSSSLSSEERAKIWAEKLKQYRKKYASQLK